MNEEQRERYQEGLDARSSHWAQAEQALRETIPDRDTAMRMARLKAARTLVDGDAHPDERHEAVMQATGYGCMGQHLGPGQRPLDGCPSIYALLAIRDHLDFLIRLDDDPLLAIGTDERTEALSIAIEAESLQTVENLLVNIRGGGPDTGLGPRPIDVDRAMPGVVDRGARTPIERISDKLQAGDQRWYCAAQLLIDTGARLTPEVLARIEHAGTQPAVTMASHGVLSEARLTDAVDGVVRTARLGGDVGKALALWESTNEERLQPIGRHVYHESVQAALARGDCDTVNDIVWKPVSSQRAGSDDFPRVVGETRFDAGQSVHVHGDDGTARTLLGHVLEAVRGAGADELAPLQDMTSTLVAAGADLGERLDSGQTIGEALGEVGLEEQVKSGLARLESREHSVQMRRFVARAGECETSVLEREERGIRARGGIITCEDLECAAGHAIRAGRTNNLKYLLQMREDGARADPNAVVKVRGETMSLAEHAAMNPPTVARAVRLLAEADPESTSVFGQSTEAHPSRTWAARARAPVPVPGRRGGVEL